MHLPVFQALKILTALLALGGSPQRTPTPDELRLFDEGTHALAAGDARAAEKAWRAGYEIAHDPAFLVRLGEAEEKAGETAEAIDSYRRYLREAPDASDRADIEQRLARLAPAAPAPAPTPQVETPGEFGGTPPPGTPAPGAAPPSAAPPASAAPPVAAAPAHVDTERPAAGKEQEDSGWNRYNATAVIASGVTLALLGTAAFYGAEASSKENDINRLVMFRFPPPQYSSVAATYTSDMADGRSDAHTSKILLVAAAGTGVVAVVFFVLDALRTPPEATPAAPPLPAVSVSIAPTGSGFGAQGAWSWRF
ncbi:MAG TPA: tetratricopeptide repeat protein [Polyangia bacterium]|nr:tetratricopeptide repeat protein [Polyangia bacterium]